MSVIWAPWATRTLVLTGTPKFTGSARKITLHSMECGDEDTCCWPTYGYGGSTPHFSDCPWSVRASTSRWTARRARCAPPARRAPRTSTPGSTSRSRSAVGRTTSSGTATTGTGRSPSGSRRSASGGASQGVPLRVRVLLDRLPEGLADVPRRQRHRRPPERPVAQRPLGRAVRPGEDAPVHGRHPGPRSPPTPPPTPAPSPVIPPDWMGPWPYPSDHYFGPPPANAYSQSYRVHNGMTDPVAYGHVQNVRQTLRWRGWNLVAPSGYYNGPRPPQSPCAFGFSEEICKFQRAVMKTSGDGYLGPKTWGGDPEDPGDLMPVRKVPGGWKWGSRGKVYRTKAQAERQGRAAYANGYQGSKKPRRKK